MGFRDFVGGTLGGVVFSCDDGLYGRGSSRREFRV